MVWILFVWLLGSPDIAITSQEFGSHQACVDAALSIRKQFGTNSGFVCVEKGVKK